MKNLLDCKVVILPTEKESSLIRYISEDKKTNQLIFYKEGRKVPPSDGFHQQYLYFVSKSQIKSGELILVPTTDGVNYDFTGCEPEIAKSDYAANDFVLKIESTTDNSLKIKRDEFTPSLRHTSMDYKIMPKIPQLFVEDFIKAEGKIDEVTIEMEFANGGYSNTNEPPPLIVKTNSENTVIIHQVEIVKQ